MNIPFYYRVTMHVGANAYVATAAWVDAFPSSDQAIFNQVVVLSEPEGQLVPGLYMWDGARWRFVFPYVEITQSIIGSSKLDIYVNSPSAISVPNGSVVWHGGVASSITTIPANGTSPYMLVSPPVAGNYVLPAASANVLGGVKSGTGVTIAGDGTISVAASGTGTVTSVNGVSPDGSGNVVLSIPAPYTLPQASPSVLGGVKIGSGLNVAGDGTISVPAGTSYTLPVATTTVLGGVKQGSNVNIAGDGTLSVAAPYSLPVSTASILGGVKVGANISVAGDGTISVAAPTAAYTLPVATSSVLGGVKQGANTTIAGDGTISVAAPYVLPASTASALGGVKIGANVNVAGDGTISVAAPYSLPIATASVLGGIKAGSGVTIAGDGTASVVVYTLPVATSTVLGGVKQGANVAIAGDGTISVAAPTAPYTLPVATTTILGGVKQGANTTIAGDGTISVAAPYSLPIASASILGGIKVGSGLSIAGDGTLSSSGGGGSYTLPPATTTTLGGVIVGSGLNVDGSGNLTATPYSLPVATSSVLGGVKQGANTSIAGDGTISVAAPYSLPAATTTVLGGVKVPLGSGLSVDGSGNIATTSSLTGGTQTSRNIGTRCRHDYQYYTGANALSCYGATAHVNMGDSVKRIEGLVLGNWIANNTGEVTPAGGSITEWASIEYPAGFYTPIEWSTASGSPHANSIVIAVNTDVISDPIPIAIPHGAKFRVWRYRAFTSGTAAQFPISASSVSSNDDKLYLYATAAPTADPMAFVTGQTTALGTFTTMSQVCFPLAILGMSSVPSVLLIGDSRLSGRADSAASTLNSGADFGRFGLGEVARSIGYARPYTNLGCETDTVRQFTLTHTNRVRQQTYHTDVICQYGVNDVTAGRTAPVILTDLQSAWGYFPTKNVWQTTIQPVTTSTDGWTTTTNQTVTAGNPVRTSLNDTFRTVLAPLKGMFEIADLVETSRNSGIWNVIAGVGVPTGDGTHETPLEYQYIQRQGVVNPARIT